MVANRIIISDLNNIVNGIALSKPDTVNPMIFDLYQIMELIKLDYIISVTDLFLLAQVKIYASENEVKYLKIGESYDSIKPAADMLVCVESTEPVSNVLQIKLAQKHLIHTLKTAAEMSTICV